MRRIYAEYPDAEFDPVLFDRPAAAGTSLRQEPEDEEDEDQDQEEDNDDADDDEDEDEDGYSE